MLHNNPEERRSHVNFFVMFSFATGFLTVKHCHINQIDLGAKEGCSVPDLCQRPNLPELP